MWVEMAFSFAKFFNVQLLAVSKLLRPENDGYTPLGDHVTWGRRRQQKPNNDHQV